MNLVSDNYKDILTWEHANSNKEWGNTSKRFLKDIVSISSKYNEREILDYGAGHGCLKSELERIYPGEYKINEYEPGRPECLNNNIPTNYVVSIDVLEHVEPDCIENVLDDLQRITRKIGLFTISTRKAVKILKDGRNAHLIVQPMEWWTEKLIKRFDIIESSYDSLSQNAKYAVTPKLL